MRKIMSNEKLKNIINKKWFLLLLMLLLTIYFFEYAVTITWDSAHYMNYVNIFEKVLPFSSWDVVRGPIFPLIIYFSNVIFGKTVQGLLINSFIYYILMLFFSYRILDECLENDNKMKIIIFSLLLIIFNPIIYGYYHVLLTEFVAITLSVVSCYLVYRLINIDYFNNKVKYIVVSLILCILVIFNWFLKQPYVSISLFPLLVAVMIIIFEKNSVKKKISTFFVLLFCLLSLLLSIKAWNKILEHFDIDSGSDRNPTVSLGSTLINAINYFDVYFGNEYNISDIENNHYLSKDEKSKIITYEENNDNSFVIIDIYDFNKRNIDTMFIDINTDELSSIEAIQIILRSFINHPILITDSYVTNYLSIIDIYGTTSTDGVGYSSTRKIDVMFSNEISTIGFKPYSYTSNIFYITEEAYTKVKDYEQPNHAFKLLNYGMLLFGKIAIILFKIIFLLLPFGLIFSIILRVKKRNKKLNMVIILFGYSLLHLLLHSITGAIIDRYAVPAMISTILGIVILLNIILYRRSR